MDGTCGLVYVVDDDASVREALAGLVASAGLTAQTAASSQEFLDMMRPGVPSCVVLDVELPGLNGIDLQQKLIRGGIQIPIIFLTGHGSIPMTVNAVKAGAADFLTKPVDGEELLSAIRQCMARYEPTNRLSDEKGFEITGASASLRHVLQLVETVAQTDSTVLLLGETGTGKELIARALHVNSRRTDRNFVKLNCAAIPTGLLESELFGHERGAFTGAVTTKVGRLELADQGTLFLDEVGDIPIEVQPKLLRALQEREFERLGSTKTRKANVRLISATNCDLEKMVARGEFRSDLYYRLNVFPVRIPPLRERREDIPLLVRHFVQKYSRQMHKHIDVVSETTLERLVSWNWPGNIRELENFIERAVILSRDRVLDAPLNELREPILGAMMADGGLIASEHLSLRPTRVFPPTEVHVAPSAAVPAGSPDLSSVERTMIERALHAARFNKSQAAKTLGLTRAQLYVRLKRHGLE